MHDTHSPRWLLNILAAITLGLLLPAPLTQAADPATTCEIAKLNAVGKKATCLVAEAIKAIRGLPSNPNVCATTFAKAFANAEAAAAKAGGACPVTSDVAVVEDLVDSCVEDFAATIAGTPAPPSCTQFPASGQTTAYQADKNDGIAELVTVPDDGTVQAGATLNYTDNGDGTITDNNTGLMWEKKTNLDLTANFANLHDADNYYDWSGNGVQETIWDWLEDINTEGGTGFAGYNDWRIPTVKELQSIVDYSIANSSPIPTMNPIFGPTQTEHYWSSTSRADFPSHAWYVDFNNGAVNPEGKNNDHFARAVRGGS